MEQKKLVEFLGVLEKLKCNTRHSWTSSGRRESVAEHSWRLAVMALLLADDFPGLDMQKVLEMCLIHDWGEALTGDIPAFEKTGRDEQVEERAVEALLAQLPPAQAGRFAKLFDEMRAMSTPEAKLWKALDKLEVLIQHNEADVATWLPLEHDLQQTYGVCECDAFAYTGKLRALAAELSAQKTEALRAAEDAGAGQAGL